MAGRTGGDFGGGGTAESGRVPGMKEGEACTVKVAVTATPGSGAAAAGTEDH